MRAEIISVGDEVLRGDVVNTNAAFLSARLCEIGFTVRYQSSVGDAEADILAALRSAVSRSHLTVLTGGLGPTDDDMTKETVAKALGRVLVPHEETAVRIAEWFRSRGAEMTGNCQKQAMVIEGSEVLPNANGTAPGIYLRQGNQAVLLLPGPPGELEPMFISEARPRLEQFTDARNHYLTLSVFGIGEPALEQSVRDLLYQSNPTAALYVKTGEVEVRITGRGETAEQAEALAKGLAKEIAGRVGSFVYSDGGEQLSEVVVRMLRERGKHIALAESCTGGMMAAAITAVAGASEVFEYGIASYADWVKRHSLDVDRSVIRRYSAVSSETAAEMAKGALYEGRADIGVGITGIAGPASGDYADKEVGLVYIAVADRETVTVAAFHFGGQRGREYIRNLAVKHALDMVRRLLSGLPVEGAGVFRHKEIAGLSRGQPRLKPPSAGKTLFGVFAALLAAASVYFGFLSPGGASGDLRPGVYNRIKTEQNALLQESKGEGGLLALAAENPDTVGWLEIEGTDYGSVVMRGENNEYYDTHGFDRGEAGGCIHIDSAEDVKTEQFDNMVLYGSGADQEQFAPLLQYTDIGFLRNHPLIRFESLFFEARTYQIISVYYADAGGGDAGGYADEESFRMADPEVFRRFVIDAKMRSVYEMPAPAAFGDRFLTLAADIADWPGARLVIVARELRAGEQPAEAEILRNAGVVYPDAWYAVNGSSPAVDADAEYERWLAWLRQYDPSIPPPAAEEAEEPLAVDDPELSKPVDTGEGTGMQGPSGTVPPAEEPPAVNPPAEPGGNGSSGGSGEVSEGMITVTSSSTGKRYSGTPLDIVSMIVEAEVGSSFHPEAIKAQAVATITYLKYQYRTSVAPTVPLLSASAAVKNCVAEVIHTAMFYDGAVIYAPYCSSMAGRSNACSEVWVQNLPYLVSVESRYDSAVAGYSRTYTYSRDEMKKILEEYYEITLSGAPENWIRILDYTSGGYVGKMSIDGQYETTGSRFRANCMYIRSAAFTCGYDAEKGQFTLVTSGYGHGVGMSQYGANFYASNDGMTYQQILSHYYTGVSFGTVAW